ncbi:PQQ-binding-like beta-propeller repeat protein [Bacteroidota bacterium]
MVFGLHKLLGRGKRGQIKETWKFDSKTSLLAPPIICDFENSGHRNVVFGTNDGKVYALDESGNIRWAFNAQEHISSAEMMFFDSETANSIQSSPVAHDINNDGKKEIIFGSEMGVVYALSHEGKPLWKFKAEGTVRGEIMIKDVNKDEKPEIIFGSGDKNIYVLSAFGELIKKYEVGCQVESTIEVHGDKIIFGCNDGIIHCIELSGKELWKIQTDAKIIAQPSIGKLFGNEQEYVVIGSIDHYLYAIQLEDGEIAWKFKTNGAIYGKASLVDINKDNKLEIIFGSCDNNIYALQPTGEKIWSYETDFWIVAPVIVDDIDKDGQLEIIAGSYDHNIYILDAKGNYMLDYVPGLSGVMQQTGAYSDVMTSEPGKITGKKLWQWQTDGIVVGCAFVQETKNIVVNTRPGKVDNLKHE